MIVTVQLLRSKPETIFVFGDNLIRKGYGGAAKLRDEPNAYGFVTKKYPDNRDESFYKPEEYRHVFNDEMIKLIRNIGYNPSKEFWISKLGSGLANKYNIWEEVIEPKIHILKMFKNVKFLF